MVRRLATSTKMLLREITNFDRNRQSDASEMELSTKTFAGKIVGVLVGENTRELAKAPACGLNSPRRVIMLFWNTMFCRKRTVRVVAPKLLRPKLLAVIFYSISSER